MSLLHSSSYIKKLSEVIGLGERAGSFKKGHWIIKEGK